MSGLQDGAYGFLGLSEVVPPGGAGIGQGLMDDVLKVGVHAGIRAQEKGKGKTRRNGVSFPALRKFSSRARDRLGVRIVRDI